MKTLNRIIVMMVVTIAAYFLVGFLFDHNNLSRVALSFVAAIVFGSLHWAYNEGWIDWIHVPLTIAWVAIALGGEKYIAGAYSITKWEVGGGYLFGMLAFALALFVPLHLWEIKIPQLVESSRKRLIAAYGFTVATLLVQCFLRFGAETWIRNTPDVWGWGVSLIAISAGIALLGCMLVQLHRSTRCFPFLPSQPHR